MGRASTLIVAAVFLLTFLLVRELRLKYQWSRSQLSLFDSDEIQSVIDEKSTLITTLISPQPTTSNGKPTTTTTTTTIPPTTTLSKTSSSAVLKATSDVAVLITSGSSSALPDIHGVVVSAMRARELLKTRPDIYLLIDAETNPASLATLRAQLEQHGVRLWLASLPRIPMDRGVNDEFRKLSAFSMLPYRRVVVVESRVLLHRALTELLDLPAWVELIFARGVATPLQSAIFIVTPSLDVSSQLEQARYPADRPPDLGEFLNWFFGSKRPLRASVPVSDCHYANTEAPFCSDTPAEQVSAFIFSDACPMLPCPDHKVSSGQLCRFARSQWMQTLAKFVPNTDALCVA